MSEAGSSRMTTWKAQAPAALIVPSSLGESVPLHMTPQPESLLSPADSSFLKGASALARFGLDIGGTLCKVVFFEPVVTPEVQASAPAETPKSRLSRTSFVDDDVETPSLEADDASCSNGYHENRTSSGATTVESLEYEGNEDSSMFKRSKPTPRVLNAKADGSKKEHSSRQARKMWVSSHDPVHIPGRGTLYFKCFGVSQIQAHLLACLNCHLVIFMSLIRSSILFQLIRFLTLPVFLAYQLNRNRTFVFNLLTILSPCCNGLFFPICFLLTVCSRIALNF